ncbi:MAG TPA: pilus assembly protein TadG-related protein [Terracidiphilus sp.]|nr:pilus assembly protein TadG-related protein [Terracidiphilus sp.]
MRKWRDESGQVLVITSLSMTILLGFVGFATDVGLLLRQRRIAQTVADSAAMAAAQESLSEGTPSSLTTGMWTAAKHDAVMNGFTPGSSSGTANSSSGVTLTINITPNVGISGYNSAGYVQANVVLKTSTIFLATFGSIIGKDYSSMNVTATAIASNAIKSNGCMYIMDEGGYANPAVDMGGNSLIAAPNCGITINGNLTMGGSGSINAKYVAVSGSYTGGGGSNWSEGVPPQNDPLSKLQNSSNQPTTNSLLGIINSCTAPTGSGMSCVYDYGCSGNSCNISNTTLTSNAIYYYDKPVNIKGSVTGSNITFYLTNNASFVFTSNGSGTFTPPGYGGSCIGSLNPYCGILIDAPTSGSNNGGTYSCSSGKGNNGNNPGELYFDFGSSTTVVEGIVYAPYMQIFGQDKGASTTFATDLVLGNICMQSSTFNVNGYTGNQSPITRVGLVY